MTSVGWRVGLTDDEQRRIRDLISAANQNDGTAPVGDQVLRELAHDRTKHLLAVDGDDISGYLNLTDAPAMAELVVHPDARRRGIGSALANMGLSEAARVPASGHTATLRPRAPPRPRSALSLFAS